MKRNVKIALIIGAVYILVMGLGLGLYYFGPEIRDKIDAEIASREIEEQLEDKYKAKFDLKVGGVEKGNQLREYSVRYPEYDVLYTFCAEIEEEIYPEWNGEDSQLYVYGIVDSEMRIVADSYSLFLYEGELLDALMKNLKGIISGDNALAVSGMNASNVITLAEHTSDFESFFNHTYTYEPIFLFLDESCSEEQIQEIQDKLMEIKFPFSVFIHEIPSNEMELLRESGIQSFFYEDEKIREKMNEMYGWDVYYYDAWRHNLEYCDNVYLWYQSTEEELYNSDRLDEIFKFIFIP